MNRMNTQNNKLIGKIFFTTDNIIKVSSETTNFVIGYDIYTEEVIKANKKLLIPVTKSMLKLTHSHKVQICLAEYVLKRDYGKITTDDVAETLNISVRTLMRMMNESETRVGNPNLHKPEKDFTN